ncbi:MAG: hypothetical protein NC244_07725 [Alistipes senegalensis]|nr:hypothetical protein [Alistipes senegalensis]
MAKKINTNEWRNKAIGYFQNCVEDIVKNEIDYVSKKVISKNINEQVYNKKFGGKKNLQTGDFNNPENLKSYTYVQRGNDNCIVHHVIRNETKPHSIFDTPIRSDYPGILGYWIEVGRVPVLWDNGDRHYVKTEQMIYVDKNGREHIVEKLFPPRPWMEKSIDELRKTSYIQDALIEGLRARGLTAKKK